MKMNESLLGYQLRLLVGSIPPWDEKRRRTYLLDERTKVPLSVDTAAWPAVKDAKQLSEVFTETDGEQNGLNLYTLKKDVARAKAIGSSLMAITTLAPDAQRLRKRHAISGPDVTSAELQKRGFNFIGYDVADDWLYSGLMNCGYSPSEKTTLNERFSMGLNEHGLFKERTRAELFQADVNDRVKAHAPFTVFGLWMR